MRRRLPRWQGSEAGQTRPVAIWLITLEKAISALAAAAAAVFALLLHSGSDAVEDWLFRLDITEGPRQLILQTLQRTLAHVGPGLMLAIGVALVFWAALLAAEAWGIWLDRAWGEFLIIIETALFLPFEIWDIASTGHWTSLITLAANLAILAYVSDLYRRRMRHRRLRDTAAPWAAAATARASGQPPQATDEATPTRRAGRQER